MNQLYHYTVDGKVEGICDIDELFEDFLEQASCHFNPILMNGPQPDEDDVLPF